VNAVAERGIEGLKVLVVGNAGGEGALDGGCEEEPTGNACMF